MTEDVDVTMVQQESDLKSAPRVKITKTCHIDCCNDLKGQFVSRNHIFREGTSRKVKVNTEARKKEISLGGESTPSIDPFAMDTNGGFYDTVKSNVRSIVCVHSMFSWSH